MFASLCANYEGSKKVREGKALMLVHQYEVFKMKDDESIEQMYSIFQTLVSGLQILKKSYVTSDHVRKILRSLPARWRPKVTAIEEGKDLNTLSVEDLVSSLLVLNLLLCHLKESHQKLLKLLNLKINHLIEILMKILLRRWPCFPTNLSIWQRRTGSF